MCSFTYSYILIAYMCQTSNFIFHKIFSFLKMKTESLNKSHSMLQISALIGS